MHSGYFLVFHGSRDRRPQLILSKLVQLVSKQVALRLILTQGNYLQQQLDASRNKNSHNYSVADHLIACESSPILSKSKFPLVETGSLELTTIPLHINIEKYAQLVQKSGANHLKILPLFLTPGVHVCEDIPAEITKVQRILAPEITLELLPYLGHYPELLAILKTQFMTSPKEGRILLAHGTKYPKGNIALQNLATQLNANVAYWSITPSLKEQVEALISKQIKRIVIVPYFLFPGKITDAIAIEVSKLQQAFPETELLWGEPLSTTGELANLIVEVLTR